MNDAIATMLERYDLSSREYALLALREILQEAALLGLWRAKFYEHAAFYGGTALRILYGLDRFSEDLDFTLLAPNPDFSFQRYLDALEAELRAFGFEVSAEIKAKTRQSAIQSAFLKGDTRLHMLAIQAQQSIIDTIPRNQVLKIRLEIDTEPPGHFETESRFLYRPIPFSVRTCTLPDLFAGKMHAVLCREWKSRVKGRDWYDFAWFAGNHPALHLRHLEERMRQSGHWKDAAPLTEEAFRALLRERIETVNINRARDEVFPFLRNPESVAVWSKEFFHDAAGRVEAV